MDGHPDIARLRFVDDRSRICSLGEVRGQPLLVTLGNGCQVHGARFDEELRRLGCAVLDLGGLTGELWLREVDEPPRPLVAPGRSATAALTRIRALAPPGELTLLVFDEASRICWRWRSRGPLTLAQLLRWVPASLPPGSAAPLASRRAHLIEAMASTIGIASAREPAPVSATDPQPAEAPSAAAGPNAARWW